jgi:hypothetical protein
MNTRNKRLKYLTGFMISFLIFIAALWLLISGSTWLVAPLADQPFIPFGTLMTWLGLLSLPTMIFFWRKVAAKPNNRLTRVFNIILIVIFIIEFSWPFVSYGLAGNWAFSFSANSEGFRGSVMASQFFTYFSAFAALLPLFLITISGLISLNRSHP